MRSFSTIVLALVLATAAFACGGKSSGGSTTPGNAAGASMGGASYGGATYAAPEGGGNPCGAMADPCGGGE